MRLDQRLQQLRHALAGLGADAHRIIGGDADDVLDFLDHSVRVGRRQVDLVDDGQYFQALLQRRVAVGDALRLHPLGGIHDQQRPVAGGQGAGHLVGEVHVPWGVDQVELVALPVLGVIQKGDALGLDRDAALTLQIHGIQHLFLHFTGVQAAAELDEPVRERGFAVIDVGNDAEVPYVFHK